MKYTLMFSVFFSVFVNAATNEDIFFQEGHIIILDEKINKKSIKKIFPRAAIYDQNDQVWSLRDRVMPRGIQNSFFINLGLYTKIKNWDQFDRDLLVKYIRNFDIDFLVKKYPQLPINKLKKAKSLIVKYDKITRI